MIQLRGYQVAAQDSIVDYFREFDGNPVVAMPTGTGKSLVIAAFLRFACTNYPSTRAMVLTHVQELIEQDLKALVNYWPTAPAGVYSAGLQRKEYEFPITFAGVMSVYKKPELFGHIDLVIIDECHLVSDKGNTAYRKLIAGLKEQNPRLKVIGFSATPYRLGKGMLTDAGGVFNDLCIDLTTYEAWNWFIAEGWLSPLVTKKTQTGFDLGGVKRRGGEFVQGQLQAAVDQHHVTVAALQEAIYYALDRRHWLVFATGIEHAEHVADELQAQGVDAAAVHSKLSNDERTDRINAFRNGQLQALVNNNVLTTGFDFDAIDCVVMLRPTSSPGLWVQMLGRGTRRAVGKDNCLVLDFAGNTRRLGPVNDPVLPRQKGQGAAGVAPVRLCEHCDCFSHAACRFCEQCGAEFSRQIKITAEASTEDVFVGAVPPIEQFNVDHIVYTRHTKEGKPDSMKVAYHCGLRRFTEYICLDHGGYAGRIARSWWQMRCPWGVPPNVEEGLKVVDHLRTPTQVSFLVKRRYPEITGYSFEGDT